MYVLNNRLIGFAIAALAGASLCGLFAPVAVHGQDMPSYGDVQDGAIEIGQLLYQGGPQRSRGEALGAAFRIGHFTGPALGRDQSITPIEFMPYAFQEDWLFFGDLRGFRSNNDRYGANMGAGVRRYVRSIDRIFGVNFYHDYDEISGNIFRDMGFGIETYGQLWDARANAYFPLGKDTQEIRAPFVAPGSTRFSGNSLLYDQIRTVGVAPLGVDMEIGVPVPGRWTEKFDVRAYAGWYHYQARNLAETLWGYKGRVQGNIFPSLAMSLELTHDQIFDTTVSFGVQYTFGGHKRADDDRPSTFDRMTTPVRRNYNIVVAQNSVRDAGLTAINPDTGNAYFIEHVSNVTTANGGQSTGTYLGTYENPFLNLGQSAQTISRPTTDIVYVHANSVYAGASTIRLSQNGLRVLGEGDVVGTGNLGDGGISGQSIDHAINIQGIGETVLPRATFARTTPSNPNSAFAFRDRPAFLDISGNGVEALVGNTEFSGFRLGQKLDFNNRNTNPNLADDPSDRLRGGESNRLVDATGQSTARGPSGNGIVAANLTNPAVGTAGSVRVRFVDINGAGGDGVLLQNNRVAFDLTNSRIHHSGGRGMFVDGGSSRITFLDTISTFNSTSGAVPTFNDQLSDRFVAGVFGARNRILEVQNTTAAASLNFSTRSSINQHATLLNTGIAQPLLANGQPDDSALNAQGILATNNAGDISLGIVLLGPIDTGSYGSFSDGLVGVGGQIPELNRQVTSQLARTDRDRTANGTITVADDIDQRVIYDPTAIINISQQQGSVSFNAPVYVVNPVNQTSGSGSAVRIDSLRSGGSVISDAPPASTTAAPLGTTITVRNRGGFDNGAATGYRRPRTATRGVDITNNAGNVQLEGGLRVHQQTITGTPVPNAQVALNYQNNRGATGQPLSHRLGRTLLLNSDTTAMALGSTVAGSDNELVRLSFTGQVDVEGTILGDGILLTDDGADYLFRNNVTVAGQTGSTRGARGIAIENMRGQTASLSGTVNQVDFRQVVTVGNSGLNSRDPAIDIRDTRLGRTVAATGAGLTPYLGQRARVNFNSQVNITDATRSLLDEDPATANPDPTGTAFVSRIHEAAGFNVWSEDLLVTGLEGGVRLGDAATTTVSQGAALVTVQELNVATVNGIGLAVREGNIRVNDGTISSTFGGPQAVSGGRSAVDIRDSNMNVALTAVSANQAGVGNSTSGQIILQQNLANYAENGITLINSIPFGTFNQTTAATSTRAAPVVSSFAVIGNETELATDRGTGGIIQASTGSGVFARNVETLTLRNMTLTGNGTAVAPGLASGGARGFIDGTSTTGVFTAPPVRRYVSLTNGLYFGFYSDLNQNTRDLAQDIPAPTDFAADGITVIRNRPTYRSNETIPETDERTRATIVNNAVTGSINYGLYTYDTPEVTVRQNTFTSSAGEISDFAQVRLVSPFADNYSYSLTRNTITETSANGVEIDNDNETLLDNGFRSLALDFIDNGLITSFANSDGLFIDWNGGTGTTAPANLDPATITMNIDLNEADLGVFEGAYAFNINTRQTSLPVTISATRNSRRFTDQLASTSIRDDNRVLLPVDPITGLATTQAGIIGSGINQRAFNIVTLGGNTTSVNIEGNHLGFTVPDPNFNVGTRPGKIEVDVTGSTFVRIVRNQIDLPTPSLAAGTSTAVRLSARSGSSVAVLANNLITVPTAPPVQLTAFRVAFVRGDLTLTSNDASEPANNALRVGIGLLPRNATPAEIDPLSLGGTIAPGSSVLINNIPRP